MLCLSGERETLIARLLQWARVFYRPKEERAPYGPLSSRKEAPKIADSEQFEQAIKKRGAGGASSFLLGPRAHARGVLLLHVPPYFSAEFRQRFARAREGVAFKVRSSLKNSSLVRSVLSSISPEFPCCRGILPVFAAFVTVRRHTLISLIFMRRALRGSSYPHSLALTRLASRGRASISFLNTLRGG